MAFVERYDGGAGNFDPLLKRLPLIGRHRWFDIEPGIHFIHARRLREPHLVHCESHRNRPAKPRRLPATHHYRRGKWPFSTTPTGSPNGLGRRNSPTGHWLPLTHPDYLADIAREFFRDRAESVARRANHSIGSGFSDPPGDCRESWR